MNKLLKVLKNSGLVKSSVATLVAVSILLSTFAGMSIFGAGWGGLKATDFASGTGTSADPYMIEDAGQLLLAVTSTDNEGVYYKLANDIYINDVTSSDWYTKAGVNKWEAPADIDDAKAFKGNFNGDGFKVYGLYVNDNNGKATADMQTAAGLFPLVGAGATITAVGVENAYINLTCNADSASGGNLTGAVGALVGATTSAQSTKPVRITNCYADEDTVINGGHIGGILGMAKGEREEKAVIIENCYTNASGNVNKSGAAGLGIMASFADTNRLGIVGVDQDNNGITVYISGCYTSVGNVAGTILRADASKSNYCPSWVAGSGVQLSADYMIGASAKTNMPLLDFTNTYKTTSKYPALRIFDREFADEVLPYTVWDGTMVEPTKGDGSNSNPFIIENAEQFAWAFHNQKAGQWPAYKLVTDIYLNNLGAINWETGAVRAGYTANQWNPGNVYLQLDGNGHMVYGLYSETNPSSYNESGDRGGLIAQNKSETVSDQWVKFTNFGMDNVYIHTSGAAGAFIGRAMGSGALVSFDGCYLGENVTLKGYFSAAYVGYGPAKINITNSANLASNIYSYKHTNETEQIRSGFVGYGVWGSAIKIENSYSLTYLHCNGGEASLTKGNSYAVSKFFPSDPQLDADKMQGYDVLTNAEKMPKLGASFMATETYPVPKKLYEAVTGIWNGEIATGFEQGSGTAEDPYIIDTGSELALATNIYNGDDRYYGKHFRITKDIYLNDIEKINWEDGTVAEGYNALTWASVTATDGLSGTVYGDNHVIRGMYINVDTWTFGGLISQSYAGVKMYNLGIDDSFVKTGRQAAMFVAHSKNSNGANFVFENCYIGANTTTIAKEGTGGFVNGMLKTASFKNCYSLGKATSPDGGKAGALAPDVWGGGTLTFENCYGIGALTANSGSTSRFTNCYSTVQDYSGIVIRTLANMQGEDALTAETKMANLGSAYKATATFPVLKSFPVYVEKEEGEGEDTPDDGIWDGSLSTPEGSGTENDPYLISNGSELAWAMSNGSTNAGRNMFYKLTADIYMNDVEQVNWSTGAAIGDYAIKQWKPKYFSGTIDGDYHVIYGLYTDKKPTSYVAGESNGVGFISENEWNYGATIKNLGFDNIYFHGASSVGAIAGNVKMGNNGKITLDKVFVGSNVTLKGQSVGGFIGYGGGALAISNCYSLVTDMTTNGGKKAGIIADVWNGANKSIDNCYALDRIYGNNCPAISFTNNYCVLENISATVVSKSQMKGLKVLNEGGALEGLGSAFQATVSYPIIKGFNETIVDESVYWDGSTSKPAKGSGIFGDPYEITNGSELAWAISSGEDEKYYKIMNDIYLNDVNAIDWTTGELKNEKYKLRQWAGGSFNGNIDGNGKVIYGMYINNSATTGKWVFSGKGLITIVDKNTVIENLGIDNAYVCGNNGVAAFVGTNNGGAAISYKNCYVGEKVTLKGYSIGGFLAVSSTAITAEGCYNAMPLENYINHPQDAADIQNRPLKAGITGDAWGQNVLSGCYSLEKIAANNHKPTNCYTTFVNNNSAATVITAENMKGLDVLSNSAKMPGLASCGLYMATDSYPVLKVFVEGIPEEAPEGDIWSGKVAQTFAGGKGTVTEPYLIANGAQLALAISQGGVNNSYFKLTKDIYLNDITVKNWEKNTSNNVWITAAPAFSGHIDGAGYIIYGLYIPESNAPASAGLICTFAKGEIKNLGMRYAYVRGNDHAAALVAKTASGGVKYIDQCFADDTCDVAFIGNVYGGAAGIVGYAQPEKTTEAKTFITNCYSKAKLSAALSPDQRANGIIGTAWWSSYSIKNCYSYGYPVYFGANSGTAPWCVYQDGEEAKMDIKDLIDNVYTDARAGYGYENMVYITPRENMTDEMAKTTMPALDFENIWETVTETSPKLQIFTSISGEETDLSKDSEVYASGKGTKKNPYIIMNEAQLRYLLESGNTKNKFYKLGADIYLNDVSKPNWRTDSPNLWYEVAYQSAQRSIPNFEGNFNGDGHYIHGLYLNSTPAIYDASAGDAAFKSIATGLFPIVSAGADIRNVHIRNSYVSGMGYAGSIVGFVQGASATRLTIVGCSADETVTIKGQTTGGMVGGGTGGLNLYYSYFTGKLDASAADLGRQGGLVGDIWHTQQDVAECYTIGYSNYRPGYVPALVINLYGTVSQTGTTVIAQSQMYGAAAKAAMPKLSWDTMWTTVNGKTPHVKVIGYDDKFSFTDEGVKGRPWSGKLATKFASGSGTAEDPYMIETAEQLAYLISIGSRSLDKHYKLANNIIVSDTSKSGWEQKATNWFTGGEFGGHFDGDGYVVEGLYFNGTGNYVALFPRVTGGAFIEKVGVVNATIINNTNDSLSQTYVAGIAGYNGGWTNETHGAPVISQCFVDDTVYLEAFFAGGIVCGSPGEWIIENCYFTGELFGESHNGTMIGNVWNSSRPSTIKNSYDASANRGVPSSNNAASVISLENYYHDGESGSIAGVTTLSIFFMKGNEAKKYMSGLDYDNIWMVVDGGTPVLRCFKNAKQYTCTREPAKVELAFVTGDGTQLDPIYGLPGYDPIPEELPVPERYGYDFGGWYYFAECDIPFDLEVFPEFNCYIYAKWIERGYTQGFEGKIDESYDFNEGAQLFKPGVEGYNPRYIHGGLRAVKTFADSDTQGMFLVSYDNMVTVGNKYDVTFWMNTGTDGASGSIELLHANHGQVDSDIVGYETVLEFSDLKAGQWKQYKFSTTANAPFFIIRVPAGVELYFDDFQVVDTAEQGALGDLEGFNPSALTGEPISALVKVILSYGWIGIVILVALGLLAVAIVAAIVIVIVLIIVKSKKKKALKKAAAAAAVEEAAPPTEE